MNLEEVMTSIANDLDYYIGVAKKIGNTVDFEASDIVGEGFLRLHKHFSSNPDRLEGLTESNIKSAMYFACHSSFIDAMRRRQVDVVSLGELPDAWFEDSDDDYNNDFDRLCEKIFERVSEVGVTIQEKKYFKDLYILMFRELAYKDVDGCWYKEESKSMRKLAQEVGLSVYTIFNDTRKIKQFIYENFREDYEDLMNGQGELIE